jgi:hypothetical protein
MAAPVGNQFWKSRSKHGRDKIFNDPQVLAEAANEYFKWCDEHPYLKPEQKKGNTIIPKNFDGDINQLDNIVNIETMRPYTMQGLCLFLHVNTIYFFDFEKGLKNMEDRNLAKDFSNIITCIRETITNQKLEGAMIGAFNPMIVSRIEGLKERTDVTSDDQPIEIGSITIIKPEERQSNIE